MNIKVEGAVIPLLFVFVASTILWGWRMLAWELLVYGVLLIVAHLVRGDRT